MSNTPLNLYEVLIEEYNSQGIDPPIDIAKMHARVMERFETIQDETERQNRVDKAMVAEFYDWLGAHKVRRSALCLSGGGIRSGTFALGLLQGLARHKLLQKFHYLSTVSGGGYIGSWLTAWIHRHPAGLNGVTDELANINPALKIDPDPHPVHYLREYSSFLTPRAGLLTADTWTFIGIYLRNLLLNWLVIIPLLVSILMIPRLVVTMTLAQPAKEQQKYWLISVFGFEKVLYGRHIFLALGFALGVWALAYIIFNRPGVREQLRERSRFWRDRADQKSLLLFCLLPLTLSALCLTTYWAWSREVEIHSKHAIYFLLFGVAFALLGWLIASVILRRLFHWDEINKLELLSLAVGGVVGGLSFLVISLQKIGNPVIGYNRSFPWTTWTQWMAWRTELYACFGVPIFLLAFLVAATFFVGFSSKSLRIQDEDREWWARLGAWVLIAIIAWSTANTLVIFGPIVLLSTPKLLASVGGLSGLIAILSGHSDKTPAKEQPDDESKKKTSLVAGLVSRSLPLLATIFIAIFLAALSLATTGVMQGLALAANHLPNSAKDWLTNVPDRPEAGYGAYVKYIYSGIQSPDTFTGAKIVHMNVLHHTSTWFVLGLALLVFFFGLGLSKFINLNLFSLHAGYRNRMIRAFLGASRPDHERNPNPLTGFDPADNIQMHELRSALLAENDFLDPVQLAATLMDSQQPLSRYLSEKGLLKNLNSLPSITTASPGLVVALRKDLNGILEDKSFRVRAQGLIAAGETALPPADPAPAEDHFLANRRFLEQAYPNLIKTDQPAAESKRLLHVINTTLNLVGGDNLAWQQRKAEPFSITPLHSGCFRLGYRNSRNYGGRDGISIGTAAATSGAAASSNMGYYTTSPVLSLVMTLFNVRLGWWLGNPGLAGDSTFALAAPKFSIAPVMYEAFGLTNDQNKYVYLTDGGHFENLAIYEMVIRRCHIIVVSDGSADGEYRFNDLGNAVRKIRIDLGVPIEFPYVPIYAESPSKGEGQGMYWALGRIRYTCIDKGENVQDGVLLYIKPAVYGNEPRDIVEYKKSYQAFPHQSTADQFFDEPQFESYRMLGSFIMDQLCGEGTDELKLHKVIDQAWKKLEVGMKNQDFENFKKWLDDWNLPED
jgi:hypothetical protein